MRAWPRSLFKLVSPSAGPWASRKTQPPEQRILATFYSTVSLSGAQVGSVAGLPRVAREGPTGYQAWQRASVTITLGQLRW